MCGSLCGVRRRRKISLSPTQIRGVSEAGIPGVRYPDERRRRRNPKRPPLPIPRHHAPMCLSVWPRYTFFEHPYPSLFHSEAGERKDEPALKKLEREIIMGAPRFLPFSGKESFLSRIFFGHSSSSHP